MVVCPNCRVESAGRFFCPRCGSLLPSPGAGPLPRAIVLPDGTALDASGWTGHWPADPGRPLSTTRGNAPCRAYALSPEARACWSDVIAARAARRLPVLAPVSVIDWEGGALVLAETLPGGHRPLAGPLVADDLAELLASALAACSLLARAMRPLHAAGLVWLTFDPAALECAGDRARIANLDLCVYPAGACPDGAPLHPAYAAPEICAFHAEEVGPATDVYHVGVYVYFALAGLLPGGPPGLGPQAFDFALPALRVYRPDLPAGIVPVIRRATALAPGDRFPSLDDFLAALAGAVAGAGRDAARGPIATRLEAAGATAPGLLHDLAGLPNQDAFALQPLVGGLMAIVADGVTHVSIGTGEVASRITVETLAADLPARLDAARDDAETRDVLEEGLLAAGEAVVAETRRVAPAGPICPTELMCTTALVAALRDGVLLLANVGDSRAYLIRGGVAEMLTVDGDVGSLQLAAGAAPEDVLALGPAALSLYTAVGVAEPDETGRIVLDPQRGRPRVSRFVVRPEDVVILCTDGLVEEGAFLEPGELAALVTRRPAAGAAELARDLVAAARARHRRASPEEPEGFGDDVTCVVIRVLS